MMITCPLSHINVTRWQVQGGGGGGIKSRAHILTRVLPFLPLLLDLLLLLLTLKSIPSNGELRTPGFSSMLDSATQETENPWFAGLSGRRARFTTESWNQIILVLTIIFVIRYLLLQSQIVICVHNMTGLSSLQSMTVFAFVIIYTTKPTSLPR